LGSSRRQTKERRLLRESTPLIVVDEGTPLILEEMATVRARAGLELGVRVLHS